MMDRSSWSRDYWDVDPRLSGGLAGNDAEDTLVSLARRATELQAQLNVAQWQMPLPGFVRGDSDDLTTLAA